MTCYAFEYADYDANDDVIESDGLQVPMGAYCSRADAIEWVEYIIENGDEYNPPMSDITTRRQYDIWELDDELSDGVIICTLEMTNN